MLAPTFDDEGREITPERSLGYDTLVIAVGSVTNDFGTPGVAEHAISLVTPAAASRFNRRLVNACLRAQTQAEPVRPGQLHVAIIGAGATGTELSAELHRTARQVVAYGLDRIDPDKDIRITLIEAAPRILPAPARAHLRRPPPSSSPSSASRCWRARGSARCRPTAWRSPTAASSRPSSWSGRPACAARTCWRTSTGSRSAAPTSSWCCRRCRPPATRTSSPSATAPSARARAAPARCRRAPRPPTSRRATWCGQIRRRLRGAPLEPFVYRDFGSLVSLGDYSAIGNLMGFVVGRSLFIEGFLARLVYRSLYTMHQTALHGYVRTALSTLGRTITRRTEPRVKLH